LKLAYESRTLYESTLSELPESLVIGRRPGCEWVVPQNLSLVSGRHAEIVKRGDRLFIRDLDSRNGILFHGERIRERELSIGDSLEVGNCTLIVAGAAAPAEVPARVAESPPAQILGQTGELEGRTYPIGSDVFTIGADPASSLHIANSMVSHNHAEIRSSGGEFWIRDLGSTNETLVNGRKLKQDEEVMLRAGDRIYVAHFALVFDDGSGVLQTRRKRWITGGAASVVAVLFLALCTRFCAPESNRLIARAKRVAAREQFDKALAMLDQAARAAGEDEERRELDQFAERVTLWRQTRESWLKAVSALEGGNWTEAANILKELRTQGDVAWTWSDEARGLCEHSLQVGRLLEIFLPSRTTMDKSYARQLILDSRKELIAAMAPLSASPPAYLTRLLAEADEVNRELNALLHRLDDFPALDRLRKWPFEVGPITAALDRKRALTNGEDRVHAESLIEAVLALGKTLQQYHALARDMQATRFDNVAEGTIELPGKDVRSLDPRIEYACSTLDEHYRTMVSAARHLSVLTNGLQQIATGAAVLDAWSDTAAVANVLECDAFMHPRVDRSRTNAVSRYDAYVGVESFYLFYMEEAGRFILNRRQTPFDTVLARSVRYIEAANRDIAFLDRHRDAVWRGGELEEQVVKLRTQRDTLHEVAREMLLRVNQNGGRPALIAAGIALQLAPDAADLAVGGQPLRDWTSAEFKRTLSKVQELSEKYRAASETGRETGRQQILATGLPGDPALKLVWE